MNKLLEKIANCKTMPELDSMRMDLVIAGKQDPETFKTLQSAFIKKKNQLNRIPLRDRTW